MGIGHPGRFEVISGEERMIVFKESDMHRGWFVGKFAPTCFETNGAEVAVKRYNKGDCEQTHHHKIASEITFVVSGKVSMNDIIYSEGDIVLVSPNESVSFKALEDSINVVVKVPCVKDDKYKG